MSKTGVRNRAVLRIRIITGIILLIAVVLLVRLYQIQVLDRGTYQALAERQYVHTVRDLYNRGSIYFTTKSDDLVSAATVKAGYLLAIDPTRIDDPAGVHTALNEIVPIDRDRFIAKAENKERTYQEVLPRISSSEADAIELLGIPGVAMYRTQWRYYPGETLAARSVGFVGYTSDSNQLTGRYGLERYYDEVLLRDENKLSVNFFAEIFSNLGSVVFNTEANRAGSIVTSIEPTVARMLDRQLQLTQESWDSALTGGIIINPKTGEIYAMNVVPSFDLNDRGGATVADFRNPLVENVYELGSIIKALTMAAGLDSGAVRPETTYYDSGKLELDTFTIGNFDGKGRGTVPMQEVLSQSLNTGVAYIVDQMGKDSFREYFKRLRLGSETGIDLPNETYGLVANLDSPRDIEYATASFGQGIALTPIAAVRALSTLGNGGYLITPHIATGIQYEDGTVRDIVYPPGEQVFSENTSEEVSRMLTEVVDDALAGGTVALPNYSVAAKTGTAQIADEVNGGYYEDRFLHSFFGYFPAYDPEFLVFLYTIEPKNVRYASETLTDPFMELTKFLINYYNLTPDR